MIRLSCVPRLHPWCALRQDLDCYFAYSPIEEAAGNLSYTRQKPHRSLPHDHLQVTYEPAPHIPPAMFGQFPEKPTGTQAPARSSTIGPTHSPVDRAIDSIVRMGFREGKQIIGMWSFSVVRLPFPRRTTLPLPPVISILPDDFEMTRDSFPSYGLLYDSQYGDLLYAGWAFQCYCRFEFCAGIRVDY